MPVPQHFTREVQVPVHYSVMREVSVPVAVPFDRIVQRQVYRDVHVPVEQQV